MNDPISREAAIEEIARWIGYIDEDMIFRIQMGLKKLPSVQSETCEGCKHYSKWKNEVEYGYSSPCTRCKRRVEDHYER